MFLLSTQILDQIGANPKNGLGVFMQNLENLERILRKEITEAVEAIANGPDLAMVNSDKGITNLTCTK